MSYCIVVGFQTCIDRCVYLSFHMTMCHQNEFQGNIKMCYLHKHLCNVPLIRLV